MHCLRNFASALLLTALAWLPAHAQMPGARDQADMQVSAATRQQLIDTLASNIKDNYVFPDVGEKTAASLRKQQERGAYDDITSAEALAAALTRDVQSATGDRHPHVFYSEQAMPEDKPAAKASAAETAARLAQIKASNFGVQKIEHLPFNIGYLELDGFAPAKEAAGTLAAAMAVLAHTDALIIDLRDNGGGDAATGALLAGYLFDERTRLNDFYHRKGNRTEPTWSAAVPPALRYGRKKEVTVLISKDSFSAAEDFSYALKNLGRVTVIGETSGGGAHAGGVVRLSPHFAVFLPTGRAVSPVTKTNWEGVGVVPDVAVNPTDALTTAQVRILENMARAERNPGTLARIRQRIDQLEGAASAITGRTSS